MVLIIENYALKTSLCAKTYYINKQQYLLKVCKLPVSVSHYLIHCVTQFEQVLGLHKALQQLGI